MQVNTQIRNARYIADGRIDCDILHPVFGWIPFTADPNDVEPHGRAIFAHIDSSGSAEPYVAPPVVEESAEDVPV